MNSSPKRMSPAQQRLADLLKFGQVDTLNFMREVFKLGKEFDGVSLREMTVAAQAHLEEFAEVPTPHDVIERLCSDAWERLARRSSLAPQEGHARPLQGDVFETMFQSFFALAAEPEPDVNEGRDEPADAACPPPSGRKDPWMQRLGHLLQLDRSGTSSFVEHLLSLRQRNELFTIADIIAAVEELHYNGTPMSADAVHDLLKQMSAAKQQRRIKVTSVSRSARRRNHVSVWEIRN